MERKVRNYTQKYKNTIVDLFNSGKTYAELSDEYGVPKTTIRQWVNNKESNSISNEDSADIKAMKKRMAMLEQENEILKKALFIFATTK